MVVEGGVWHVRALLKVFKLCSIASLQGWDVALGPNEGLPVLEGGWASVGGGQVLDPALSRHVVVVQFGEEETVDFPWFQM